MARYKARIKASRIDGSDWKVTGSGGVSVLSYECNDEACDCIGTGFVVTGSASVSIDNMFMVEGEGSYTRLVWCDKGRIVG